LNTKEDRLFDVWDSETTMLDPEESRSMSNPFFPENHVVLWGIQARYEDGKHQTFVMPPTKLGRLFREPGSLIVGQNIKFDLHYLRKYMEVENFKTLVNNILIWDTQIAEYVLSGQLKTMISLDDLAELYGGEVKATEHKAVKDLFAGGMGAEFADPKELEAYLKHDLYTTGDVAEQQMARCTQDQFDLIIQMGECLKAVEEMEFNGMFTDVDAVEDMQVNIIDSIVTQTSMAQTYMAGESTDHADFAEHKPDWYNSGNVLSCMLFGGTIDYKARVNKGLYKTGPRKGKVKEGWDYRTIVFDRIMEPEDVGAEHTKKKTKAGNIIYTTDEDVLRNAAHHPLLSGFMMQAIGQVTIIKKYNKILSTYLNNFSSMEIKDIVHHTLNQTIAATGRLSSSKPNLQNVPIATEDPLTNVKACFTSRYLNGRILEIDFKQLEVCVLAWLTMDPTLIDDIKHGRDIHTEVGEMVLGVGKVTKRERRDIKAVVFAMLYGAGAKGIAKSSGIPLERVRKIMDSFYGRYDTIKDFYTHFSDAIRDFGHCLDEIYRGPHGPEHYFEWVSPTGRTYKFHQDQYRPGPSYTEVRNYPVQGTATADIVPVLLGKIRKVVCQMDRVKMVTTTHDSVTLDCADMSEVKEVCKELHEKVFSDLDDIINSTFKNMKWNVPLTLEYEVGESWGNLKELDITKEPWYNSGTHTK